MRLMKSAMTTVCCNATPPSAPAVQYPFHLLFQNFQRFKFLCVFLLSFHFSCAIYFFLFLDSLLHGLTPLVSTKRGHSRSNGFRPSREHNLFFSLYPILLFIIHQSFALFIGFYSDVDSKPNTVLIIVLDYWWKEP